MTHHLQVAYAGGKSLCPLMPSSFQTTGSTEREEAGEISRELKIFWQAQEGKSCLLLGSQAVEMLQDRKHVPLTELTNLF